MVLALSGADQLAVVQVRSDGGFEFGANAGEEWGCNVWRGGFATELEVAHWRGTRMRVRCLPTWQTGDKRFGGSLKFNIY